MNFEKICLGLFLGLLLVKVNIVKAEEISNPDQICYLYPEYDWTWTEKFMTYSGLNIDQYIFWKSVSWGYFEKYKKYPVSAFMLNRSLYIQPQNIADLIVSDTENTWITEKIKNSQEYNKIINKEINDPLNKNKLFFEKIRYGEGKDGSINFEQDYSLDLFLTIAHTGKTIITGRRKTLQDKWQITFEFNDFYDFTWNSHYGNTLKNWLLQTGVNLAVVSQKSGVINPYYIRVKFTDIR